MNRMIKLFQQKSNKKFDEYLLAKKNAVTHPENFADAFPLPQVLCAVLKAESDVWAKAAELLRKEELSK